jgi:hypothetical protein
MSFGRQDIIFSKFRSGEKFLREGPEHHVASASSLSPRCPHYAETVVNIGRYTSQRKKIVVNLNALLEVNERVHVLVVVMNGTECVYFLGSEIQGSGKTRHDFGSNRLLASSVKTEPEQEKNIGGLH